MDHVIKVLRVVPLRSQTGQYGGPSDSAAAQASLAQHFTNLQVSLLYGHLAGDRPDAVNGIRCSTTRVHLLSRRVGFASAYSYSFVKLAFREIRGADIVHVSLSREIIPILCSLMALIARRRLIVQPHGMLTARKSMRNSVLDVIVKPIYQRAACVIALAKQEEEELASWCGTHRKVMVLGNPPVNHGSTIQSTGGSPPEYSAIFLGRLERRKRLDVYLQAALVAQARGWNDNYLVVGPDAPGDAPIDFSVTNVDRLPAVSPDSVRITLAKAKIFVLPSYREPWGNVLVTALSLGMPVVVTESAALAERVREWQAGIVVPDGDACALAEAVHRMTSRNSDHAEMGARARRFFDAELAPEALLRGLGEAYALSLPN